MSGRAETGEKCLVNGRRERQSFKGTLISPLTVVRLCSLMQLLLCNTASVTQPTTAPLPLLSLTSRTFFPASLNVDLQTTCPFSREGMHPG